MKGTEKQIEWANGIIETIEKVMWNFEEMNSNHPMIEQLKVLHNTIIGNMKKDYAGNLIDGFKYLKVTGNADVDYKEFSDSLIVGEKVFDRKYR